MIYIIVLIIFIVGVTVSFLLIKERSTKSNIKETKHLDSRTQYWFIYIKIMSPQPYNLLKENILSSYNRNKDQILTTMDSLKAKGISEDDIADSIDGKFWSNENFLEYANEMLIIALYRSWELNLKYTLEFLRDETIKGAMNWNELIKEYKVFGIKIKKCNKYKELDELRCINNCLKHSGFVDSNLINRNRKWKNIKKIIINNEELIRLENATSAFRESFMLMIKSYLDM